MQTTDFVATVFDGASNPNKVTVTFTMCWRRFESASIR